MASKNPPIRGQFFDMEVTLPSPNPNLPGVSAIVKFLRTTREWAEWVANMARGVGPVVEVLTVTAALDFPNIAANGGTQDLTVTVTGVKTIDPEPVVALGIPIGLNAGLVFHGWVSANDTVTVRATNATAGAIDPASATFRVEVRRY